MVVLGDKKMYILYVTTKLKHLDTKYKAKPRTYDINNVKFTK